MRHPLSHLRRAADRAEGGLLASARQDIESVLARYGDDPRVCLVAAQLLCVTRDYQRAFDVLGRTAETAPGAAEPARELQIRIAGRLGWDHDVRDVIAAARAAAPRKLRWAALAASVQAQGGDVAGALARAREAVAIDPRIASLQMEVANLAARAGDADVARPAVAAALELEPEDTRYRLEAARVLISVGELGDARHQLDRALAIEPGCDDATLWLARLAAWRGDADAARRGAESLPARADAQAILAGVAIADARFGDALDLANRAIDLDGGCSEAFMWRAEAAMRLGRYEQAHDDVTRAMMSADGFLLCAWILRLLINIEEGDPETVLGPNRSQEIIEGLSGLCPDAEAAFGSGSHEPIRDVLARALVLLRGNRTPIATQVVDGRLVRLPTGGGPRHRSRIALESIRAVAPELALRALDEVVARYPHLSLPLAHRGELKLWLGDLRGARVDLNRAIEVDPHTRWAYIGLTGIDILEGDAQRALETCARGIRAMNDTEGPAVFVYRGEALRILGRLDEAIEDLTRAVDERPTRLSAWIDLALAHGARGDSERLVALFEKVCRDAPGLISDAARECDTPVWLDAGFSPAPGERMRVLEQALQMMRGNRGSTCHTYFTANGRLRLVARPRRGDTAHDHDRGDLERARTMMQRFGLARVESGESAPVAPRRLLSDEEVARFVERGYLIVRDCFARDAARDWVTHAVERIRTEPQRWVKNYDPDDPRGDLSRFDPADPSSWTWERIDLEGDRTVAIEQFAPRAWDAICDLLGGPDRIETREWSDYFVVNVSTTDGPNPASGSWHLDDPSEATRLRDFRTGLIVFAWFSDVEPDSGGTLLAPESVPRVARVLADQPDGVDFRDCTAAAEITDQCTEIVELTGAAGDVVLVHPFMLHSAAKNPSGRVRWLANPLIYTREPLRFDRADADYSPVELAVVNALGRGA